MKILLLATFAIAISIVAVKGEETSYSKLACIAAQKAIKERLFKPEIARFPSCFSKGEVNVDANAAETGFKIYSWVDLPDQLGIYRRRSYIVEVTRDAAAKIWRTLILEF